MGDIGRLGPEYRGQIALFGQHRAEGADKAALHISWRETGPGGEQGLVRRFRVRHRNAPGLALGIEAGGEGPAHVGLLHLQDIDRARTDAGEPVAPGGREHDQGAGGRHEVEIIHLPQAAFTDLLHDVEGGQNHALVRVRRGPSMDYVAAQSVLDLAGTQRAPVEEVGIGAARTIWLEREVALE